MGARFGSEAPAVGEWHMHCHVLNHMMMGMMGSLLIVRGEEPFLGLPSGEPCEMDMSPHANTIVALDLTWSPPALAVAPGTTVTFDFQAPFHTVMTVSTAGGALPIEINNGGGPGDAVPAGTSRSVVINGPPGGVINYQCGIHLASMTGTIQLI